MEIPVSGFVVHSDGSDPLHSHKLYITSWDGRPVHEHPFSGMTSFNNGHSHYYAGTTELAESGVQHVHQYYAVTSMNDGHTHIVRGTTGPAVSFPGGGHYHYFEGFTTVNGRFPHSHMYRGTTGNEIGS
ncbi:YmaF family protein [Paenibacillus beijingensis]|uniref:YmaF family protein n=1 Tax=Paenibacillus beijingensis TaxID=1126833 RepID=A0A0D5NPJ4_9BACL|nr:YmaF family protein [Paenibacillus beijingensis]AJY77219.1 hypothetical protein VN24_25025 [Paenibacillus beijingensis]